MYSVRHNYLLFYCFKCWQLVLARIGHHQANIYKNLKNAGAYNITRQYYRIHKISEMIIPSNTTYIIVY
jgi:hypothetical protein